MPRLLTVLSRAGAQVGDADDQQCQASIFPAHGGQPTDDCASIPILAVPLHVPGS